MRPNRARAADQRRGGETAVGPAQKDGEAVKRSREEKKAGSQQREQIALYLLPCGGPGAGGDEAWRTFRPGALAVSE